MLLFSAPIFITMYSSDPIDDPNMIPVACRNRDLVESRLEHATQPKGKRPRKQSIKGFWTKTRTPSSTLTSCDLEQARTPGDTPSVCHSSREGSPAGQELPWQ